MSAGLDVDAVLAEHRSLIQVGQAKACTCGWEDGFVADVSSAHRAHVAAKVREAVAEWIESEAVVRPAAEAMEDAAFKYLGRDLGTIHRDDIAAAALATLAEAVRDA